MAHIVAFIDGLNLELTSPDLHPGLNSKCKLRLSSIFFFLICNVSLNHLLIQAHCACVISYGPDTARSPISLSEIRKLFLQRFSRIRFHDLHDLGNAVFRWKTYHNAHVIPLNIPLNKFNLGIHLPYLIQLDQQIFINAINQYLVSISWDPYDVIHASIYTVGLPSRFHNCASISRNREDRGARYTPGLTSGDLLRCIRFISLL